MDVRDVNLTVTAHVYKGEFARINNHSHRFAA